ncbi:MAG: replication factor C large subunit [archaeon]
MTWVEKYRPKYLEQIKGQDEAVSKVLGFINDFGKKKKAIVLHGPPGTGKTTIAHAIANEKNSEIFELNASDLRNKANLQEILRPAMEQQSLTKKNKIILVDEVDGIAGKIDFGGITELISIIEATSYPIIITANDIWKKNLSELRKKAELIGLKEITKKEITQVLLEILEQEKIFLNLNIVTSIVERAKGDLRAAINDLQAVSRTRDPSLLTLDERDKDVDIFSVLRKIFKESPTTKMLGDFDTVNMPIDEISLWIEENIPAEYKGEELAKAIECLSKADIFKGRIYKQQYWRFLVYQNILLSYGISASKKYPRKNFTKYNKPTRILKIWMSNQRSIRKKSIAEKYSKLAHIGEKRARNEFPILKQIINSNPAIGKELKLTPEEFEYLAK